jgi:hypothetical protein
MSIVFFVIQFFSYDKGRYVYCFFSVILLFFNVFLCDTIVFCVILLFFCAILLFSMFFWDTLLFEW